jgi:hypothetical protein
MFDLEQAIAQWQQQMIAGGIKSPHVMDELESHLRDDVEQQEHNGLSLPQAFETAVQRLGQAAALEGEFEKVRRNEAPERVKHAFLTLAGIPDHYLHEHMNRLNSNIEPRWATYLKATAFLAPAVILWALSIVFVIPKLEQISAHAGGQPLPAVLRMMVALTHNGLFISAAVIVLFLLLEWRSSQWPRYRRAAVGCGTFVLNAVVLISIFMMVITAILVAPALMNHAR